MTGVDAESFRRGGGEYTVVGWGQIPVTTLAFDEERFVRLPSDVGTVHIGLLTTVGDGSAPTVTETFTLADAVGSPTLEIHGDRLWIAYPRMVDDAPRIRLLGAPLDTFLLDPGVSAFDIDTVFSEAGTTIVPVVPASPGCLTDARLVYPQPGLASDGSRLVLAWVSRGAQPSACLSLAASLPGALFDAGDVLWSPIAIGSNAASLGSIRSVAGGTTADGFTPYPIVDAQSLRGKVFVSAELALGNLRRRGVSEIHVASSSEVWNGDVTLPALPPLRGPSLALGAWAGDLVIALGGDATPYDPSTLLETSSERRLSSSRAPIALAAPPSNQSPTADAGGPYAASEGEFIALDASSSTDPSGDPLTYEWDLDGDGLFDDAIGIAPEASFPQDGSYPVSVRVSDGELFDVADAVVTVTNVAPSVEAPSIAGADGEEAWRRRPRTSSIRGWTTTTSARSTGATVRRRRRAR